MASYWHSIGTMLQGRGADIEPRRRSRYEPDLGDPQGFAVETPEDRALAVPDLESPATAKPGKTDAARSSEAQERGSHRDETPRDDPERGAQGEQRGDVSAPEALETTEAAVSSALSEPSDEPTRTAQRASRRNPDVADDSTSKVDTHSDDAVNALPVAVPTEASRPVAAETKVPTASEDEIDPTESEAQTNPQSSDELPRSVAELREEIAALVHAEPLDASRSEPSDDSRTNEPAQPQPLVVEIDHIEIEIARPIAPPQAARRARREPAKPVVSLEDYLSQGGGGSA